VDGDGNDDLAIGHGEINYSSGGGSLITQFDVSVFYGDGTAWSGVKNDSSADVIIERELGVTSGDAIVIHLPFEIMDVDSDGAGEIVVRSPAQYSASGSDEIEVVKGALYSGTISMADELAFRVVDDTGFGLGDFKAFKADDSTDMWFYMSQPLFDDGNGLYTEEGKTLFGAMPDGTDASYDVSAIATASFIPLSGGQMGSGGVVLADINEDTALDAVFTAPYLETTSYYNGGIWLVNSLASSLSQETPTGLDPDTEAMTTVHGDDAYQMFGLSVVDFGDLNGDGYRDIAVREGNYDSVKSDSTASYFMDTIWVLSGEKMMGADAGDMEPDDAVLLDFLYESDLARTGFPMNSSDFDGDGKDDFSMTAQSFPTTDASGAMTLSGKIYVYVSGINGW
jgi:hypothetical protein